MAFQSVLSSRVATVVLALGLPLLVDCSSHSPSNTNAAQITADSGTDADTVTCGGGDTYVANLSKPGTSSVFTFVLVSSDPAPPAQGNNTWVMKVLDAQGQPVSGVTFTITPTMPMHGHGTQIVPQITPQGDGYQITPLYFFMPGLWSIQIDAKSSSAQDSVTFEFCISG